jgi:hypothetical protein
VTRLHQSAEFGLLRDLCARDSLAGRPLSVKLTGFDRECRRGFAQRR